ncbi:MAG: serine/threonine-protein kinase [Thermoleophilaceae bacterium]|nr:serine/threonine-protein kinase [Thermoleophilaceae bacterium]
MPLQAGTRFGAYEVINLIGSGGMGEVWLATEVRLGRKVALKLLPSDLTRDPTRVLRFEQEARAASALNHPNVCTIYALAETSDGQHYIAMEYVEGETLRRRLTTSRLSVREALDIGIQVAAALTVAHTAGIIHRDIKPENVMLRPDGVVKVLDFGLAKLAPVLPEGADTTQMGVNTDAGTVVGTAAYMSPEQARGQQVDARTDIWSLGVMLYEMVAGRSPFAGPSGSDVFAGILQNEPAPVARFEPTAPAEVQRILTKTLRKDRVQRYQTVQDLLLDLQALRADFQSHARSGSGPTLLNATEQEASAIKGSTLGGWSKRGRFAGAATLIVAAGALGSWWWFAGPSPQAAVNSSSVRRNLTRLTFDGGLQTDATWSPDGRSIAYTSDRAGNEDVWVQSMAGGDPVRLTRSPSRDAEPSWSPDDRNIVFRSEREGGGLFIVPARGGAERQLTSSGVYPEWTPDGSEILFRTGGVRGGGLFVSLHVVPADGGEPREILRDFLHGGGWSWIGSHPDGRISALGIHGQSGAGFYTVTRDGRNVTRSAFAPGLPLPLQDGSASGQGTRVVRFVWNRTGTALYVEALVNEVHNVWRVRVEPKTLRWQAAEQLTGGAGADKGAALSRDGTRLVFTTERKSSRLWVFPFDAAAGRITGEGTPLTPEDDTIGGSDLSPDGTKAAYIVRHSGSKSVDLWAVDVSSGERELLAQNVITACWSPDGKAIAYTLIRHEPGEWVAAGRALSGTERLLGRWRRDSAFLVSDWTRDGTAILGSYFHPIASAAPLALWSSSTQSSKPDRILLADPPASLWQGRFSPNGRWVTFGVGRPGAQGVELMVASAAGAPPAEWTRIAPDHVFPDKPRWAPDGRTLYFLSRHPGLFFNLWGVRFDPEGGRPVGAPFMITRFESPGNMIDPDIAEIESGISAQRAMLTLATVTGNIWMLDNVDK